MIPAKTHTIDITKHLAKLIPLNKLDKEQCQELAAKAEIIEFKKGQIISFGIPKQRLVYLLSGHLEKSSNSLQAEIIQADTEIALFPVLKPNNRCHITAKSRVSLLCIDSELVDMLLSWNSSSGLEVNEIEASESGDWMAGLLQSQTIRNLTPAKIQALISAVEPVEVKAKERVFSQGDEANDYYIITQGECCIEYQKNSQQTIQKIAILHTGDSFGEEALITGSLQNTSVRAVADSTLLRLSKEDFKNILEPLVNKIDQSRSQLLKQKGALLLDLSPSGNFKENNNTVNIPLPQLRGRLATLDKKKVYVVISNDDKAAATGSFILNQYRFKAYWLKQLSNHPAKQETPIEQVPAHHNQIEELKRALTKANNEIDRYTHTHDDFCERIRQLESDISTSKDRTKQAIIESNTLKNNFDVNLNNHLQEINTKFSKAIEEKEILSKQLQSNIIEVTEQKVQATSKQAELSIDVEQLRSQLLNQQKYTAQQTEQNHQLRQDLLQMEEENNKLNQESVQHHDEIDNQLKQQETISQKLAETEQALADESAQCQILKSTLDQLKEQVNEQKQQQESLTLELKDQQSNYKTLNDTLNQTQQNLGLSEEKNTESNKQIEGLEKDLLKQAKDSQEHIQAIEQDHKNDLDQKQIELTAIESDLSDTQQQNKILDDFLTEQNAVNTALLSENDQALKNNTELQQNNDSQAQELEQRASKLDEFQQQMDVAHEDISNLNIDKSNLETQLKTAINYKEYAESEQKCAEENTDYLSGVIEELKAEASTQEKEAQQTLSALQEKLQIELDKPVLVDGAKQDELEAKIEDQKALNSAAEVTNNILEGRVNKLVTDLSEANFKIDQAEVLVAEAEDSLAIALTSQHRSSLAVTAGRQGSGSNQQNEHQDEVAKLAKLRKKHIKDEKARRKAEKKGRRSLPRLLMLLLIIAGAVYGATDYLGIDLSSELAPLIELLQPTWESVQAMIKPLIDRVL